MTEIKKETKIPKKFPIICQSILIYILIYIFFWCNVLPSIAGRCRLIHIFPFFHLSGRNIVCAKFTSVECICKGLCCENKWQIPAFNLYAFLLRKHFHFSLYSSERILYKFLYQNFGFCYVEICLLFKFRNICFEKTFCCV